MEKLFIDWENVKRAKGSRCMKVLITGINGFAASHLARFLLDKGYEVHGTVRVRSDLHRIKDIKNNMQLHYVELSDTISINNLLLELKPDEIYHLAAQSFVKSSWEAPIETYTTNVLGTVSLLECVRNTCTAKVVVTSTSEVYGDQKGILNEVTPPTPNTHYGVSKFSQDMIARLYADVYGMDVVVTRSFNITGAGRADVFVDSNFCKQIAEMEKYEEVDNILCHGNLESARDFTDITDVVKGYYLAMKKGIAGEVYCFCREEPTKIQDLLNLMLKHAKVDVRTEIDKSRFRPVDTATMIGDCSKAKALGWKVTVPLEQSIIELLNYWRARV